MRDEKNCSPCNKKYKALISKYVPYVLKYMPCILSKNVIRKTEIPNIYQVNDGRKANFSREMNDVEDPHIFEHFLHLFKLIDQITGVVVSYVI